MSKRLEIATTLLSSLLISNIEIPITDDDVEECSSGAYLKRGTGYYIPSISDAWMERQNKSQRYTLKTTTIEKMVKEAYKYADEVIRQENL